MWSGLDGYYLVRRGCSGCNINVVFQSASPQEFLAALVVGWVFLWDWVETLSSALMLWRGQHREGDKTGEIKCVLSVRVAASWDIAAYRVFGVRPIGLAAIERLVPKRATIPAISYFLEDMILINVWGAHLIGVLFLYESVAALDWAARLFRVRINSSPGQKHPHNPPHAAT